MGNKLIERLLSAGYRIAGHYGVVRKRYSGYGAMALRVGKKC